MKHKGYRQLTFFLLIAMIFTLAGFEPAPAAQQATPFQARSTPPAGLQRIDEATVQANIKTGQMPMKDRLLSSTGQYSVRLSDPTVSQMWTAAREGNSVFGADAALAYQQQLVSKQATVTSEVQRLGGEVIASMQKVFNGLIVEIDPEGARELLQVPGVVSVSPIPEYQIALDETVPWIGAEALQTNENLDGSGIRIAVLDTGIDYTHEHLGGSGDQADTDAAFADPVDPDVPNGLYPNAKVIGGYDFVGSEWTGGAGSPPLAPDEDPIDDQLDGHGTHVASIIGGVETSNLGPGVAPGAEFYALGVCSKVTTACSGVAMIQAYEWVSDPNNDLDFSDRADVVNISIGSIYGQVNDADVFALEELVNLGAVVVVSAGNNANVPFITGSPSTTRGVISVAQSSVPSYEARRLEVISPTAAADLYPMVWQTWSAPATNVVTGDVVFVGTACDGEDLLADPTDAIALIDRGACAFSQKVFNVEAAGAIGALLGLIDDSQPFESATEGQMIGIQAHMIHKATADVIKALLDGGETVTVSFDPANNIPLPDVMMSTSSRGPAFDLNYIKPNISAPGASVSANSGDQGYSIFGGTSGAAPMVTGSAALLLEGSGGSGSLTPLQVKARLMNNAEPITWQDQPNGMLNPITRQGAGRVNVEAAFNASTLAWVPTDDEPSLSFGFATVAHPYSAQKQVQVLNVGTVDRTYDISATLRYEGDAATGVNITPSVTSITVPAGRSARFNVRLDIDDPALLSDWNLGGQLSTSGALLTELEIDGFVTLVESGGGGDVLNLPFHFLPRKAADVSVVNENMPTQPGETGTIQIVNTSDISAVVEAYPLFEVSANLHFSPPPNNSPVDLALVGADVVDEGADFVTAFFVVNTHESRNHPINSIHIVEIDIDQDGDPDYEVFTSDLGAETTGVFNGMPITVLFDYSTSQTSLQYFVDVYLNSHTMILPVDLPVADNVWNFFVLSADGYFTGLIWDWSPDGPLPGQMWHTFNGNYPINLDAVNFNVAPNSVYEASATISTSGGNSTQIGLLFYYRNGVFEREAEAVLFEGVQQFTNFIFMPVIGR